MVSSNLTSQPDWLDTFPTATPAYGFDEGGMWFTGDASGVSYPVRTNYDIASETRCDVIFTFTHTDIDEGCPDHGICYFKADTEPYWSWGTDVTRIAVQYDCGHPEIAGPNNSVGSEYALQVGQTYTARVIYMPDQSLVIHELYEGQGIEGTLLDQISLNTDRLDAGTPYRVGFSADLDSGVPDKAYFTYLELSVDPPPPTPQRVFRAIHLPRRRLDAVNEVDGAPLDVQPGTVIYDYEQNKLYAGQDNGDVLQIGGGESSFDQNLNTTDSVTFSSVSLSNGTQLTVGSFDNMTGGQNGIALHCYVGYELNWQGGRLRKVAIGDTDGTPLNIYCDSALEFPGSGSANMQIDGTGLTFPDGTTQASAGVKSDATGITGATVVTNIVKISQAAYTALEVKDSATVYIIEG